VSYNGGTERGPKAQPFARARWRRCFALSLAFRLFARIALLDFVVFFTGGSDLDGIGIYVAVTYPVQGFTRPQLSRGFFWQGRPSDRASP
jgi:hypothetical protein